MSASDAQRRVALVTGASRGIGRAIAERLAADGLHVVLNYRSNQAAAEEALAAIRERGGSAELCRFDVGDEAEVSAALGELKSRHRIGVLVNNAGLARDAAFPAMSLDAWREVTRTTLDGFFLVTQALVMDMVGARWGRIVNITSLAGQIGSRGQVNYSAAKAGLIGATRSLALELAKRKITVNAVAPGFIETDMLGALPTDELKKLVPLQRLGTPHEVAGLVSYLVSDAAAYVTGQVIGINGGLGAG
ncbi:MAG TPA: 3-oxoacyl-ACP reductase FabG [Polyangiaceae bacterium]|nr:3-oxoacyl-ACP reductase FabG [Polyangiaceae bacterium]